VNNTMKDLDLIKEALQHLEENSTAGIVRKEAALLAVDRVADRLDSTQHCPGCERSHL
jgi:hypothetical protein